MQAHFTADPSQGMPWLHARYPSASSTAQPVSSFLHLPPFSDDDNDGAPEAAIRGAPASLTPARLVPPGAATSTHHERETRESDNSYEDRKANGTDESVRAFIKQRQSRTWTRQPLKSHPHPAQPGRAATFSGRKFLPHQEPMIFSRSATSAMVITGLAA
jgi:hypothetical protein